MLTALVQGTTDPLGHITAFEYDRSELDMPIAWGVAPESNTVFDASLDFAAQGQFYLRREL
jgi:hypothetical protein